MNGEWPANALTGLLMLVAVGGLIVAGVVAIIIAVECWFNSVRKK